MYEEADAVAYHDRTVATSTAHPDYSTCLLRSFANGRDADGCAGAAGAEVTRGRRSASRHRGHRQVPTGPTRPRHRRRRGAAWRCFEIDAGESRHLTGRPVVARSGHPCRAISSLLRLLREVAALGGLDGQRSDLPRWPAQRRRSDQFPAERRSPLGVGSSCLPALRSVAAGVRKQQPGDGVAWVRALLLSALCGEGLVSRCSRRVGGRCRSVRCVAPEPVAGGAGDCGSSFRR